MKTIPITESAVIIRTDFSNADGWRELSQQASEPPDPFFFNFEMLDDRDYDGASIEELLEVIPEDYPHSFLVIADDEAVSKKGHALLVVDLMEEPGQSFRAEAAHVASIENNLSIGNMGFEEFMNAVDESGVYRGVPEI